MAGFFNKLIGKTPAGDKADGKAGVIDENGEAANQDVPGFSRQPDGRLAANGASSDGPKSDDGPGERKAAGASRSGVDGKGPKAQGNSSSSGAKPAGGRAEKSPPDTSALNRQTVQAVTFANYENLESVPDMVTTPPELMVGQVTGLAVQDAANYMNAIMQIAVAAQAVAIKKAAEKPPLAELEMPLLKEVQKMVSEAVSVYGKVSSTAAESSQTVISDLNSA